MPAAIAVSPGMTVMAALNKPGTAEQFVLSRFGG